MTSRDALTEPHDDRPRSSLLRERLRHAAEAESFEARALEWRSRSERERSFAFIGLMRMSDEIARNRPTPYVKPPLDFPRFSSVHHRRATS